MAELSLLNVGTGDTKISFDPEGTEEERIQAGMLVRDMIRKGYAILVETGHKDEKGHTLYRRAYDFDELTSEYIVAGIPPDMDTGTISQDPKEEKTPSVTTGRKRGRRVATERVPATKRKAVAVPRTAGG